MSSWIKWNKLDRNGFEVPFEVILDTLGFSRAVLNYLGSGNSGLIHVNIHLFGVFHGFRFPDYRIFRCFIFSTLLPFRNQLIPARTMSEIGPLYVILRFGPGQLWDDNTGYCCFRRIHGFFKLLGHWISLYFTLEHELHYFWHFINTPL